MVSEIHRSVVKGQEGTDNQHQSVGDISTLFHHMMNKRSPPPRHKPGQQIQLQVDPTAYICIQNIWRIAATPTKGLLRTERVNRDDRRSGGKPHSVRSHWCWWNRQDIHRSHRSPRRSHQATVWRQPSVHSLRPVSHLARSFPPPALQGHRCRHRKPRGSDPLTTIPILKEDAHNP